LSLDVNVRRVHLDDLPTVERLEREAFGKDAYVAMTLRQFFDLAGPLFLVATHADRVVGYGLILPEVERANGCFVSMAVAAKWRRHGIGQALMTAMLAEKRAQDFHLIWLTVEPNNKPAIRLAESFDFEAAPDEVPDYYGPGRNRLVMTRMRQPDDS
jgi:[ribosomal protein S18]-alanine N-acetyltransferase